MKIALSKRITLVTRDLLLFKLNLLFLWNKSHKCKELIEVKADMNEYKSQTSHSTLNVTLNDQNHYNLYE